MSRVIKAGMTRIIYDPLEPKRDSEAPETVFEPNSNQTEPEYKAAYDEVVEAAQNEVSMILEDARQTAREIIDDAEKTAEKLLEAAREDGRLMGEREGYQNGMDEAIAELTRFFSSAQAEVDGVLNAAHEERDRLLDEMEPRVYRLALDIAEKIIGYELQENNKAYLSIIETAVSAIQGEPGITLRVNSEDYLREFDSRDKIKLSTARGTVTAGVVIDGSVDPGDCLIDTDGGIVDPSVSAQLEQLAYNLGLDFEE